MTGPVGFRQFLTLTQEVSKVESMIKLYTENKIVIVSNKIIFSKLDICVLSCVIHLHNIICIIVPCSKL